VRKLKAQVGVETLFIIGFLFIILVAALYIYFSRSSSIANTEVILSARKICNEFQTSINQAASSSFGFRTKVILPDKIFSNSLNVTVDAQNKIIFLNLSSTLLLCPLSFQNITNGNSSFFSIPSGNITIRTNESGVVIIEKM